MPKGITWRSHKIAKDQTLSRFQFNKEVQIKLASLILNEAGRNWCKERLCLYLTNRRIREPYVRWCERRTSSLTSGEAVYSIIGYLLVCQCTAVTLTFLIPFKCSSICLSCAFFSYSLMISN